MADLLNVIISSEKRRNHLILLKNGQQTWDEIKTQLNVTATGMLPQIRILEEQGLIVREGKVYSLTELGRLVVHYLEPFDKTLMVIDSQKKFWQEHDIGALPKDLLLRIRELGIIQV
ncbi:MAG: transcriptional regulator, partial [Methanoregula sp.]|nr:transcriptional regulator [Methanoregula sp.]